MNKTIEIYGKNTLRMLILLAALIVPVTFGGKIIKNSGILQLNQNIEYATICGSLILIYYFIFMLSAKKLVLPFHTMVALKYFLVILVIYWFCFDLYMIIQYQGIYLDYQALIRSRAIVWRDVAELPLDVQYKDAYVLFLLITTFLRALMLVYIGYILLNNNDQKKLSARRKIRTKSVEELKINLHPSILKKYQNKD